MTSQEGQRFHEWDRYQIKALFQQVIGSKAVGFLEQDQTVNYYRTEKNFVLDFKRDGRVVSLDISDLSRVYSLNEFPKVVAINFYEAQNFIANLRTLLKFVMSGANSNKYTETNETLQPDTLSFLRYLKTLAETIDSDCTIELSPASQRRERLYATATRHLKNVKIYSTEAIQDKKNSKP